MKKLLSENMLRFGTKNLREQHLNQVRSLMVESVYLTNDKGQSREAQSSQFKRVDAPNRIEIVASGNSNKNDTITGLKPGEKITSDQGGNVPSQNLKGWMTGLKVDVNLQLYLGDFKTIDKYFLLTPAEKESAVWGKYVQHTAKITSIKVTNRVDKSILEDEFKYRVPIPMTVNNGSTLPINHKLTLVGDDYLVLGRYRSDYPTKLGGYTGNVFQPAESSVVEIKFEITKTIPAQFYIDRATNYGKYATEEDKQNAINKAKAKGDYVKTITGKAETVIYNDLLRIKKAVEGEPK